MEIELSFSINHIGKLGHPHAEWVLSAGTEVSSIDLNVTSSSSFPQFFPGLHVRASYIKLGIVASCSTFWKRLYSICTTGLNIWWNLIMELFRYGDFFSGCFKCMDSILVILIEWFR